MVHETHRPPIDHSTEVTEQAGTGQSTYTTGTTVVGLALDDRAVLAADQRMSLGGRVVASKNMKKVEQVHPTGAVAVSGSVGPAQQYVQHLRTEAQLYDSRRSNAMSINALARAAGTVIRGTPVSSILAGVGESGAHLYELDGSGAVVEDAYAAGGSGMQVAYGVLEREFDADAGREAAVQAAVDAVEAASERDTASGNGVHVATIDGSGVDIAEGTAPTEVVRDAA